MKTTTALQENSVIKMKKVLFVCTGNTCRSPMAEAYFNYAAKEQGLDAVSFSAGLYTEDGLPFSENSVLALAEEGITLNGTSRQITEDMVKESDYVFGLTRNHGHTVISAFPEYSQKVYGFPCDISDPFGGDIVTYKKCLAGIKDGIDKIIEYIKNEDKHNDA